MSSPARLGAATSGSSLYLRLEFLSSLFMSMGLSPEVVPRTKVNTNVDKKLLHPILGDCFCLPVSHGNNTNGKRLYEYRCSRTTVVTRSAARGIPTALRQRSKGHQQKTKTSGRCAATQHWKEQFSTLLSSKSAPRRAWGQFQHNPIDGWVARRWRTCVQREGQKENSENMVLRRNSTRVARLSAKIIK